MPPFPIHNHPPVTRPLISGIRRSAAALLIILAGTSSLPAATLGIPGTSAAPPAAVSAPNVTDRRAQTEMRLAEVRRQLAAIGSPGSSGAMPGERQQLLKSLAAAYAAHLKLIDLPDPSNSARTDLPDLPVLAAEFAGPPPYSALRVDALRQEFDALRERRQGLTSNERALDSRKRAQVDAQRRAGEAVRQAEDRLARARGDQEIERERQGRDLATLRLQLAEAELANTTLGETLLKAELAVLRAASDELQVLIARVLPGQRLSKEELAQQQSVLSAYLVKLKHETDARSAENTRRLAEREKLEKALGEAAPAGADSQRLKLLDEMLETDLVVLSMLNWQQRLTETARELWAQRYRGLSSNDATVRQEVSVELNKFADDLRTRRPLLNDLLTTTQAAVREQELRVDGLAPDAPAGAAEAATLKTLKERLQAYQRVNVTVERIDRQLDRWLTDDLGYAGNSDVSYWKVGLVQASQKLKQLWNFEMFAVEDSTVIDGKTVSVTYGVTIGKTIGSLLLFILGYWLFSLLARRLQGVMVQRFGVNPQVASVIRRWIMISLGAVLVIFILNLARIPLAAFAFMGGALAIGIGFGAQTIIKNVISGIIILFERKIRVGDIIELGGMTGHVTAVNLRASTVRGFDGVEALVPNSSFLEQQVVNWTYSNSRKRREIRIGIAYGAPLRQAAEIITSCAEDHGQVLKDPPPEVYFEDFGDNALQMVLLFWIELDDKTNSRRVDSDLRFAMEKRLAAAGIAIPFPQRDIRLSVADALPVRMAASAATAGNDDSGKLPLPG